jgi:hypothetical protein
VAAFEQAERRAAGQQHLRRSLLDAELAREFLRGRLGAAGQAREEVELVGGRERLERPEAGRDLHQRHRGHGRAARDQLTGVGVSRGRPLSGRHCLRSFLRFAARGATVASGDGQLGPGRVRRALVDVDPRNLGSSGARPYRLSRRAARGRLGRAGRASG